MILPSRTLLVVLASWAALGVAAAVWPTLHSAAVWVGVGIGIVALLDLVQSSRASAPEARRRVSDSLALGVAVSVDVFLSYGRNVTAVQVFDHVPAGFRFTGLPATLTLTQGQETRLRYRLQPFERGEHVFGSIELRVPSPWRLWERRLNVPVPHAVRVYPNFAALTRTALLAADAHTPTTGVMKRRRRGEGSDFEHLREYRQGDMLRQIDWKATRRMGKLISRQYQDERDQRIVLLVDCGRRMGARDDVLSHFDHALDAVLLLAYVGLRQGDAVGLMTFGGPERYLEPHKSRAAIRRILHTVYDLQPTLTATDFEAATTQLTQRLRRRSLVVIFTNLRDEDDESLLNAVKLLSARHLVLVASLRERVLDDAQHTGVRSARDAALRSAAVEYRRLREMTLLKLRQAGVLCLDVAPQELAIATVNRYLAIKAEGRL